jgi:hypothetical protein
MTDDEWGYFEPFLILLISMRAALDRGAPPQKEHPCERRCGVVRYNEMYGNRGAGAA